MYNDMISKQLTHRTIREFLDKQIPTEVFEQLMEVGRRTATSTGIQGCTIIRVTDANIKREIAEVCKQEYVGRAPELLIFLVDQFRNSCIAKEKNCVEEGSKDMDRFFSGYTDACITAQNIVNAAESMDLGTVYLGSILNDSKRICEILKLPILTFPVVGLGIGYPNQNPQIKPKLDIRLRVFENTYKEYDNYLEEIKEYDEEMKTYYDLRDMSRSVDSFSDQVVAKLSQLMPKRQEILVDIRSQGFDLGINNK